MNNTSIFFVLTGLLVRLIVPLAITAVFVYLLHRLDARWQAEAVKEHNILLKEELICCKKHGLTVEEVRLKAVENGQQCWQLLRLPNGYLQEDCLDCEVFLTAPTPASQHSHAHIN